MKKYLLVLFIILIFSSLAFAAVPTMDDLGGSNTSGGAANSQEVQNLGTIYLRANTSDVEAGHNLIDVSYDSSTLGDIYIYYWSGIPDGAYTYYLDYEQLSISNFTNVSNNYCTFNITLPSASSIPTETTHISFYLGLVQANTPPPPFTNDFGDLEASEIDVISAPTNYYTYMTYISDDTTEAPTLDFPTSSTTITESISLQYDQPENAYSETVRLIFTRTGGSEDLNSPHLCTLESETSGTDKTLTIDGSDLLSSTGVESISGGNTLVDDAIYSVRIEYRDLAFNAVAFDTNTGITYNNDDIINISGGDYNAGTSFSPGTDNNAFFRIQMDKTGSGGDPTVTAIEFDILGSYQTTDISAIKLWRSTDDSFASGTDTQIAIDNTHSMDPFTANINESVGTTTLYYFVTVDVNSGASAFDAIGAEIIRASDITASTSVSGNFPITGSTHPLPVTLSSFTVGLSGKPIINWTTQTETNNAYWNIYRGISQNMGQAIQINYGDMILGQGTATEPTNYTYADNYPILESTTYYYWLECVDNAGEAETLGPVSLFIPEGIVNNGTPAAPDDYGLKQNFPNPFNPDTRISFALLENSPVRLTIYNLKGEKIKTVFEGFVEADMVQSAYWDGTDDNGKTVATGVYLYRLRTNSTSYSKRMLLMK
jgi:hypothetical protein